MASTTSVENEQSALDKPVITVPAEEGIASYYLITGSFRLRENADYQADLLAKEVSKLKL